MKNYTESDILKYGELQLIQGSIKFSSYKEFINVDDAEKWAKKNYLDWSEKYKSSIERIDFQLEEKICNDAIACFCGESYREVNGYLRSDTENTECTSLTAKMIHMLVALTSYAPLVPDNIIVYRAIGDDFIESLIKNNIKGEATLEKGFMSTSLVKSVISKNGEFSQYKKMIKIYIKSDTCAFYVDYIVRRNEQELIICPHNYLYLIKYPYLDKESKKEIYECVLSPYPI